LMVQIYSVSLIVTICFVSFIEVSSSTEGLITRSTINKSPCTQKQTKMSFDRLAQQPEALLVLRVF
jgi:hypothetical protein